MTGQALTLDKDRVLIVDDDPEIRSLLSDYLEQNGFATAQAANGDEMEPLIDSFDPDLMLSTL